PDRNNNYDIRLHPQRWKNFKEFTYKQLAELMTDYGNIDMPSIAKMARAKQPGLIMVDRTVHGEYENYQTPEQKVPEKPLDYPWETCMTMGEAWGYVPNDKYKSVNKLVHLLADVVAKGGNFLLNVGPKPDGTFPDTVVERLAGIGKWMNINKEAIYASRPIAPYKQANVCYTTTKEGSVYAIYLLEENVVSPSKINLKGFPEITKTINLLGVKEKLKWKQANGSLTIDLSASAKKLQHALVFKIN
ncbi:MAG: alpha-L-fucosidase, partial [Flavobacterium sp.]